MATIKGLDKHLRRVASARDSAQVIARGLYAAGQKIESTAERSITEGATSGKGHVPSRPGQPPNEDTGHLRRNIETEIESTARNPTVTVTSHAEYSAALEFGTSKMAARPFMRPATEQHRSDVAKDVAMAVSIHIRKG